MITNTFNEEKNRINEHLINTTDDINNYFNVSDWDCNELDYNPFDISNITLYNPIYSNFDNEKKSNSIQFCHEKHIVNSNTVFSKKTNENINKDIFIKYGPLLDPCHYMVGKYKMDDNLLSLPSSTNTNLHPKISTIHNATYVDNFCCAIIHMLNEKHNFVHGVEYYGSALGIQKQFRMNIVDDLDYLQTHDFFQENIGHLFHTNIFTKTGFTNNALNTTYKKKEAIELGDDIVLTDFDLNNDTDSYISNRSRSSSISVNENTKELLINSNDLQETITINGNESDDSDDNSIESISDNENDNIDDDSDNCDDDNSDDEYISNDDDSSVDEEPLYVYINNFPIQMICLSKCNDTLDSLLKQGIIDEEQGRSALFQIVMILLTLQKSFHFTHNDLHTNNVMFSNTDNEYLYYQYNNKTYKVPTYGRIYKLIDFGRAILSYNGITYCSDSFKDDGDANGQYNYEPFYDSTKKRIEPNMSFDLCRLACSIYDFIIEDEMEKSNMDGFQQIIYEWCHDDNNKNILYKKNGNERYPNFKLYKMIARLVHKHVPKQQLSRDFFKVYKLDDDMSITDAITKDNCFINIDNIQSYV